MQVGGTGRRPGRVGPRLHVHTGDATTRRLGGTYGGAPVETAEIAVLLGGSKVDTEERGATVGRHTRTRVGEAGERGRHAGGRLHRVPPLGLLDQTALAPGGRGSGPRLLPVPARERGKDDGQREGSAPRRQ